jgi:hypothetical protein
MMMDGIVSRTDILEEVIDVHLDCFLGLLVGLDLHEDY